MPAHLREGDDPSFGFCRICGSFKVPPYPGFYRDSVCSQACMDEFKWRETLRIVRKKYYPHPQQQQKGNTKS